MRVFLGPLPPLPCSALFISLFRCGQCGLSLDYLAAPWTPYRLRRQELVDEPIRLGDKLIEIHLGIRPGRRPRALAAPGAKLPRRVVEGPRAERGRRGAARFSFLFHRPCRSSRRCKSARDSRPSRSACSRSSTQTSTYRSLKARGSRGSSPFSMHRSRAM